MLDAALTIQQTQSDAQHDALTGLPNRMLFHLSVNQQLAIARRNKSEPSLLFIELDGFKAITASHGHAVGDQLLQAVARRIADATRDSDIAARLGGDEFAVALIQTGVEPALAFAHALIAIISEPYRIGEIEARISASIGVAGYPASACEIDTLLKQADHAMYSAKSAGKRRASVASS